MALPTSGVLDLSDIQTEFGGSNPISLSEYYAGGLYVPSGTSGTNGAVPTSGEIAVSDFYGTQSSFVCTITEGTYSDPQGSSHGYLKAVTTNVTLVVNNIQPHGSRTPTSLSGVSLDGFTVARDTKGNNTSFYFVTDAGTATARSQTVFTSLEVEGGGTLNLASADYFRAATVVLNGNVWRWDISSTVSTAWPTWDGSGTRTVTINE
jgi:hypothetical protein